MSTKRRASLDPAVESAPKRLRVDLGDEEGVASRAGDRIGGRRDSCDRLSILSDELLVRILHFVDVQDLITCQVVSNRFNRLSNDSQVWRRLYYEAFVRKRALRVPGAKEREGEEGRVVGSSRKANWLGEERGAKRERDGREEIDWKRQYKLRHNWSKGACEVDEIRVGEKGLGETSLLVRLAEGVVVTADIDGLRAWDFKNKSLLAEIELGHPPSSLAVDEQKASKGGDIEVAVGFDNGAFGTFRLSIKETKFEKLYEHPASSNGRVSALAYTHPHILTITDAQLLSLYTFDPKPLASISQTLGSQLNTVEVENQKPSTFHPRLLSSLKSHSAWPPLSLSLRSTSQSIIASIAYTMPTFLNGWSVGLQELHLTPTGEISRSRLASAIENGFQPLSPSIPSSSPSSPPSLTPQSPRTPEKQTRPTSLSYSHPYLLASHSDNTLTLYLVNSNSSDLTIKKDTKLWGHTSAVSSTHVGGRGKAVSISRRGNELRVWELEGGLSSAASKRRLGASSVVVRPEKEKSRLEETLAMALQPDSERGMTTMSTVNDVDAIRGWVGFDEEVVVVLKESGAGVRALMIYDFT